MKRTITVLLSTYNGEHCLPDLFDSLLSQTILPDRILVRDDGSSDATRKVLSAYQSRFSELVVYAGHNLGARDSFFRLMIQAASPSEPMTDYYALCDQDDRWLPERLARSIASMDEFAATSYAGATIPLLTCGRPQLVDSDFAIIKETRKSVLPSPSFGNALVENICTGCTAAFNRALLEQITTSVMPKDVVMHDWWLYLFAAGCGHVVYDPEPQVLYRQHSGNVVGMSATHFGHQIRRIRRFLAAKGRSTVAMQIAVFLQCFGSLLLPDNRELAERFVYRQQTITERLSLARNRNLRRQRPGDDLLFRLMLLLGHYRME